MKRMAETRGFENGKLSPYVKQPCADVTKPVLFPDKPGDSAKIQSVLQSLRKDDPSLSKPPKRHSHDPNRTSLQAQLDQLKFSEAASPGRLMSDHKHN